MLSHLIVPKTLQQLQASSDLASLSASQIQTELEQLVTNRQVNKKMIGQFEVFCKNSLFDDGNELEQPVNQLPQVDARTKRGPGTPRKRGLMTTAKKPFKSPFKSPVAGVDSNENISYKKQKVATKSPVVNVVQLNDSAREKLSVTQLQQLLSQRKQLIQQLHSDIEHLQQAIKDTELKKQTKGGNEDGRMEMLIEKWKDAAKETLTALKEAALARVQNNPDMSNAVTLGKLIQSFGLDPAQIDYNEDYDEFE